MLRTSSVRQAVRATTTAARCLGASSLSCLGASSLSTSSSGTSAAADAIIGAHSEHVVPTYGRFPIALSHGRGSYVFATDGTRYLDMAGGIAVSCLGHAHPGLTAALAAQAGRLLHCSNLYFTEQQGRLAERLCAHMAADTGGAAGKANPITTPPKRRSPPLPSSTAGLDGLGAAAAKIESASNAEKARKTATATADGGGKGKAASSSTAAEDQALAAGVKSGKEVVGEADKATEDTAARLESGE